MKHIPNILTLCNLLCGCIAISYCFSGSINSMITGSYFIYAAAIFDFLDGFAARALKAYSPLGKQLDSLADMVTFGVAPSFIIFQLLNLSVSMAINPIPNYILYSAFIIAAFSALRLAKFNIDDSQTTHFIGVPTPINGMMLASFPALIKMFYNTSFFDMLISPYFILVVILLSSYMLVAPLKMIALKFKNFSFGDNKMRYVLIILSILIIVKFGFVGLIPIYVLYILSSIVTNLFEKKEV